MAAVCKFCGQEIEENGFCGCDGAVAERTAMAPQPEAVTAVEAAMDGTAENITNAPQAVVGEVSPVVSVGETISPQTLPNIPTPPVHGIPVQQPVQPPATAYQQPVQPVQQPVQPPATAYQQPVQPQPTTAYQPPVQPQPTTAYQPPQAGQQPYGTPQQQPPQPPPQGYGYQQPNQAGYQPPTAGQQPPAQFQMPSQITDAASAVSSTFMELLKNPLGAAKAGTINTTNSWVLIGLFALSYLLYMFFRGFRFYGFNSLSGTSNFIFPLLTVALSIALLFFTLVLSCNFAKVPAVSNQSIFGLIAISSIPLTLGYLANLVVALLFGSLGISSLLITLIGLFAQIIFILILEHGMSDKIKNNTHRVLAVGISLAIFLGTMTLMTGFLQNLMLARSSFGTFWDMFDY